MCELFAMSARHPAAVNFSLEEFASHGGLSGPHKDGWGIAFYEGRDARIIRESIPAASSACERFLESEPIHSGTVLSHIRRATQGGIALANTQPFARELGGRLHVFVHNGNLDVSGMTDASLAHFRPLGETDSERTFCNLLARLESLWLQDGDAPSLKSRGEVLERFAHDLRDLGIGNFLYCDGELPFAHGHRRHQSDGEIRPPGLHFLCRRCTGESGADIEATGLKVKIHSSFRQSISRSRNAREAMRFRWQNEWSCEPRACLKRCFRQAFICALRVTMERQRITR